MFKEKAINEATEQAINEAINTARKNNAINNAAKAKQELDKDDSPQVAEAAIQSFKEVLGFLPSDDMAAVNFNMAIAYKRLDKIEEMKQELDKASSLNYDSEKIISLYLVAGNHLHSNGKYPDAEKLFTSLSKNPKCPETVKIDVFARLAEAQKANGNAIGYIKSLQDAVNAYEAKPAEIYKETAFSVYKILGTYILENANEIATDANTPKDMAKEKYIEARKYLLKARDIAADNDHALFNNLGLAELGVAKADNTLVDYQSAATNIRQAINWVCREEALGLASNSLELKQNYQANLTAVFEVANNGGFDHEDVLSGNFNDQEQLTDLLGNDNLESSDF